ncbi:hypothetical protein [Haloarcula sediminis]|uniref:hypothetical protein n=1 Tax=Haloarcula sediminis TaxID=3111777 RepID=UPI002D781401|nr:hypothetical protein [Haloarcula sp. CK38]
MSPSYPPATGTGARSPVVGVLELPGDLAGAIADTKDGVGTVQFEAGDRAVTRDERTVRVTGTYGWPALGQFGGSLHGER